MKKSLYSASEAALILSRLISSGKISAADIRKEHKAAKEIEELERRLMKLKGGTERAEKKKTQPSPARKLHGKYLSLIRQIPKSERGKFSSLSKKQGKQAAIEALQERVKPKTS